MSRLSRAGWLAIVFSVVTAAGAAATTVRAVVIHGEDGAPIVSTMWEPSQRPAPAVLLLHMQGRTKDEWQPLGSKLGDAGIAALAIEVRGLGGAAAGDMETRIDAAPLLAEVRAAVDFLAARPDIRPGSIGIVGASMGANLSVLAAAADPRVRSLALLSPGLDYRGLRTDAALKKYAERPALFIVSSKDPYALRSVRALMAESPGAREQRVIDAMGHGTMMLSRDPDLLGGIVDWFKRTLP